MNYSKKTENRNILIVDDEPDVLDLLRLHLQSQQWFVSVVQSPSQAIELLEKQSFFLIITDIAMPELDGYEFISKLQEKHIYSEIILMTGFGYNPRHTLVKINKKCKYPILFKPFEFKKSKLRDLVQQAWENYHKAP